MNRKELKAKAKLDIRGNLGTFFLVALIIYALAMAFVLPLSIVDGIAMIRGNEESSWSSLAGVLFIFIDAPMSLGLTMMFLSLVRGIKPQVGDVFQGFKYFGKALGLYLLIGLFTFLWSLLFIIPGIVKGYSYSMALWILADDPSKTVMECINESKEMTKGYKGDLFVLDLSFIGWSLLVPLTLCLLSIWLLPYMNATYGNAYLWLKDRRSTTTLKA